MTDTLATSGEPPRRPRLPDELAARYGEGTAEAPEETRRQAANDEPDAERGISPVGRRFGGGEQGKVLGMVGMVAAAGLLIVATWDRGDAKPESSTLEKTPARQVVNYEGPDADSPRLSQAAHDPNAPVPNPDGTLTTGGAGGGAPPMQPTPAAAGSSAADQRCQLAEAAQRAPIIAYSANRGLGGFAGPAAPAGEGAREATELDKLRWTGGVAQARAEMLPDRNFLITAGASIPCVLQTALDNSVPGYATCLVARDIYSESC
jgi:type IV secretion system protein VirB10